MPYFKKCKQCNKQLTKEQQWKKQKHCSRKCYIESSIRIVKLTLCQQCDKELTRSQIMLKNKFCSRECDSLSRRKYKNQHKCIYCKKIYERKFNLSDRNKTNISSGAKYCSHDCYYKHSSDELKRLLPSRFWSKVKKTDTCWLWTSNKTIFGYGQFSHNGQPRAAHRVSWELTNGAIPKSLFVLHKCDNPPCVRPDHLFLGTHKDNMIDRNKKGRVSHGEKHYATKLKSKDIIDIRKRNKAKESLLMLAKEYGISIQSACDITHYRTWKHIP